MKGVDINADKSRTLRYSINSMINFKKETGMDFTEALTKLGSEDGKIDFGLMRTLFFYGLKWEDADLTPEGTGDIMDILIEKVGFEGTVKLLIQAIQKALGISDSDIESVSPNAVSH